MRIESILLIMICTISTVAVILSILLVAKIIRNKDPENR